MARRKKDDLHALYSFYKYLFYGGGIIIGIIVFLVFAFNYENIFKEDIKAMKEGYESISQTIRKANEFKSKLLEKFNEIDLNITTIRFKGKGLEIKAFVVLTQEEKRLGLSVFEKLNENEGMLFLYEKEDYYRFWMKDMRFPIDIIWINKDFKIVDITENISPDTFPQVFTSKEPAQYILEVNAGFAKNNNIKIGDYIEFDFENTTNKNKEEGL